MKRVAAKIVDGAMCAMLDWLQRRHAFPGHESLELYIKTHCRKSRDEFFSGEKFEAAPEERLRWRSPIKTGFAENNECCVSLFPCEAGWKQPTVIMLHALMSASDLGYREWARKFNQRNWNAAFVHLPYHYSRTPQGYRNGELAVTADIVRTAEGLRAGVSEARQLMDWLRALGCEEFGLWACSYGGWIGALLSSVETFRWVALIQPILNTHHAIWESPAGRAIRRELQRAKVHPQMVAELFALCSPVHGTPQPTQLVMGAGAYDRIAPLEVIRDVQQKWGGELLVANQGHFGFQLMRNTWNWLQAGGHLEPIHQSSKVC